MTMVFDLAADEIRRREAMLTAMDYNPVQALESETVAVRMLYSGLDEHQQRILTELQAAGVIPCFR